MYASFFLQDVLLSSSWLYPSLMCFCNRFWCRPVSMREYLWKPLGRIKFLQR